MKEKVYIFTTDEFGSEPKMQFCLPIDEISCLIYKEKSVLEPNGETKIILKGNTTLHFAGIGNVSIFNRLKELLRK